MEDNKRRQTTCTASEFHRFGGSHLQGSGGQISAGRHPAAKVVAENLCVRRWSTAVLILLLLAVLGAPPRRRRHRHSHPRIITDAISFSWRPFKVCPVPSRVVAINARNFDPRC